MKTILYEIHNRVAYISLNRPEKRNALNPELVNDLSEAFHQAKADTQVKVIVLKALGKVFSAGADLDYLHQLQQNSLADNLADSAKLKDLFYTIYTFPKVVIAQVEGHAIAGGCGLTSVCDLVFAVPEAQFAYTEVKIGFIPALVACFLVRKLGEGRTKELLLSGQLISAETALAYGLINFVMPAHLIAEKVTNYAEKLANETSASSISMTKQLLNMAQQMSLEESLDLAIKLNAEARATDDCKKGISAFLNKEKLSW
ncbi:MAG: enoyl-CoA hydratase/isomerase family protein [Sphingobacteriaceae bacterium]